MQAFFLFSSKVFWSCVLDPSQKIIPVCVSNFAKKIVQNKKDKMYLFAEVFNFNCHVLETSLFQLCENYQKGFLKF